jgi:CHAT domain-containing protein
MIEARDIQKAIESTPKGRQFQVKVVLAPTLDDLVDALNQFDPQILHFSGHGGGSSLLLDNERAGDDGGDVIDFERVARLLGATAAKVSLLVLAACDTVVGAECLVAPDRSVVAMSDSIEDEAACAFSARFYKSLSSGASIAHSLEQAKLLLEQKGYEDADLPTLIVSTAKSGETTFV